jgi:hypothetical protein
MKFDDAARDSGQLINSNRQTSVSSYEKYIKLMLLSGVFQSELYLPVSEREVNGGYIDIYLEHSPGKDNVNWEWVWELKYLKDEDATDDTIKAAQDEAATQIARYRADPYFAGKTDVKYAALVFIGKKRYAVKVL